MNEREQALIQIVTDELAGCAGRLMQKGWQPQLVVFAPDELPRIAGYKVALVVPLGSVQADS